MYLNGLYVPKNEKEAFYIFIRCIETMTEEAERRVAGPVYLRLRRMFLEGTGVSQDLKVISAIESEILPLLHLVLSGDVMYKKSLGWGNSWRTRRKHGPVAGGKASGDSWTLNEAIFMMKVSEAITKMISISEGNQHDICHFMKVWGFVRTIGEAEGLDERTLMTLELAAVVHDIACPILRKEIGRAPGETGKLRPPLVREFYEDSGLGYQILLGSGFSGECRRAGE